MASQSPPESSQETPSQSTKREERVWKLKDCDMKIGSCGKRDIKDQFMMIDLVFKFSDNANPKVVELHYSPEAIKSAWNTCCNALDEIVYLEDCITHTENKNGFIEFLHQELAVFKEKQKLERSQGTGSSQGSQRFVGKKSVQYYKAAVEEFEGKFYLIGSEVFLLGGEGRKLTEDEVLNLPVIISWKGPDHEFIWDEKQCIELLCQILKDMNEMQNPKYKSFPLAVIVAHLAGQLYKPIVDKQGAFSTQMSVSGPASGTGKSLFQTAGMNMFHGEPQPTTTSMTEATFYETLSEETLFVKEFNIKKSGRSNTIGVNFLEMAVPAIWERNQRTVKSGRGKGIAHRINHPMHIDANILEADLEAAHLGDAILGKIQLIYTGPDSLSDPEETEKVQRILKNSKALFKFKPVLLSFGIDTLLEIVTYEELESYENIMKKPGNKREGQPIANYDRFFKIVKEGAIKYDIPLPPVLEPDTIDRTALIYFNTNNEEEERVERVASQLIEVIQVDRTKLLVEHSERSANFKVKMTDLGCYAPSLVQDLRHLKGGSTMFDGRKQRVAFLPESAMPEELIKDLHSLCCRYDQAMKSFAEEEDKSLDAYGDKFYQRVANYRAQEDAFDELAKDIDDGDMGEVGDEMYGGDISDEDLNNNDMDSQNGDDRKRDRSSDKDGSDREQPTKVYKCENPACQDFDRVFQYASQKTRHDGSKRHTEAVSH